jgi:hypothetical protein
MLTDNKLKALIDFIAKLPGMLDKAAHSDIVKKGFFAGGVIDSESHSVPDFYTITIATCKRKITSDEIENLKRVVPDILKHGHVPDEVYETHGLAQDLDVYGDCRTAGRSCVYGDEGLD